MVIAESTYCKQEFYWVKQVKCHLNHRKCTAKGNKLVGLHLPLGSEIADKGKRLSGLDNRDSTPLRTPVERRALKTQPMDSRNEVTCLTLLIEVD